MSQNVGIGTTSPTANLHLQSTIQTNTAIDLVFETGTIDPANNLGDNDWYITGTDGYNSAKCAKAPLIFNSGGDAQLVYFFDTPLSKEITISFDYKYDDPTGQVNFLISNNAFSFAPPSHPDWKFYSTKYISQSTSDVIKISVNAQQVEAFPIVHMDNIMITYEDGHVLKIEDGTEANGYFLQSDALGHTEWHDLRAELNQNINANIQDLKFDSITNELSIDQGNIVHVSGLRNDIGNSLRISGSDIVASSGMSLHLPGLDSTYSSLHFNADSCTMQWGISDDLERGLYSTRWGINNTASGPRSTAWGGSNLASESNCTAWGTSNTASGASSTSWGVFNTSSGIRSTTWGYNNASSGNTSTSWGSDNATSASSSTAWGVSNTSSGTRSTAWGYDNVSSGITSTSWGSGNATSASSSTAWGENNTSSGIQSTSWGSGNASSDTSSTSWGDDNISSGVRSTTWGNDNEVVGLSGTSWGQRNIVNSDFGTCWGDSNKVNAVQGTAWGFSNIVSGINTTVFGLNNSCGGENSIVWGRDNGGSGNMSTTFGSENSNSGFLGTCGGYNNEIYFTSTGSTVFGGFNYTDAAYNFIAGLGNKTYSYAETALGYYNYSDPGGSGGIDPDDLLLSVGNGTAEAPNNAFAIKKNGDVGMGINYPEEDFHLYKNGSVNMLIESNTNDAILNFKAASDCRINMGLNDEFKMEFNQTFERFDMANLLYIDNDNIGIDKSSPSFDLHMQNDSAAKPGNSSWTVSSDLRLKKDITAFTDGLDIISAIEPVWYTYNGLADIPEETYVGTIAQDLELIAPYMVTEFTYRDEDGNAENYKAVNYGAMDFVLINAIKEQQAIIQNQQEIISNQQAQIDEIMRILESEKRSTNK